MKEPFDYSIVPYTFGSGWKRSFPCAETVVSRLGNRSSDAGNERFNDRKINFDAWCAIFLLTAVLQILYLQRICNGICNAIIVYQSVYYFDFVAGGRCFFIFQTLL